MDTVMLAADIVAKTLDRPLQGAQVDLAFPGESMDHVVAAFHFDTVDSTNDAAKRLIAEGRLAGRGYVCAREQTAGKGQRGRTWLSPRDAGLYLSIVDLLVRTPADPTPYTLAAGIACAEVLEAATGVSVRLKPINDLYVEDRKLGGILSEIVLEGQRICALITGVGVNVRTADRALVGSKPAPVSLQELLPAHQFAHLDVGSLREKLVARVFAWNSIADGGDRGALADAWKRYQRDNPCNELAARTGWHGRVD